MSPRKGKLRLFEHFSARKRQNLGVLSIFSPGGALCHVDAAVRYYNVWGDVPLEDEMSTQAELLKEKYRALQAAGALDIKFCFGPLAEQTDESVCASINQALDAILADQYSELPAVGKSRRING
jgi:hypothetical protein